MFRFEHGDFLYLLLAVPALALVLGLYRWWRQRAIRRLGNPALVYRLLDGASEARFWFKNNLLSLSLALLAVAWANPQRGAQPRQVAMRSSNVFIALDVSNSMLVEDVAPNRLELSKTFALKLLRALRRERVGLIFFAGDAFMQTPLTEDQSFITATLRDASPDYVTAQGTAIPLAIELAMRSFGEEEAGGRALIIITDGENHDANAVEAARAARKAGIAVYMVGAGTAQGGPVPARSFGGEEFKRDENGEIVVSRLNEDLLAEVADAGGGASYRVQQGDAAIRALQTAVEQLEKREAEVRSYDTFESYYQWILFPALILLALDSWILWRKGKTVPGTGSPVPGTGNSAPAKPVNVA